MGASIENTTPDKVNDRHVLHEGLLTFDWLSDITSLFVGHLTVTLQKILEIPPRAKEDVFSSCFVHFITEC